MESLPCSSDYYPSQNNVVTVTPDEHYSVDPYLRSKFTGLALVKIWVTSPVQIAYRLQDLITGGFYTRGSDEAEHIHLSNMKIDPSLRGRAIPTLTLTACVLKELAKNVMQLTLFPLYLLGLFVASVIGVFCPQIGRRIFRILDELFYIHPKDPDSRASVLEQAGNLAAPCMHTKEFRKEKNLFRYAPGGKYHPHSSLSLYNKLQKMIQKASSYFTENELRALKENTRAIGANLGNNDATEAFALNNHRPLSQEVENNRLRLQAAIQSLSAAIESWARETNDNYRASLNAATGDTYLLATHLNNQPVRI